MFLTCVEVGLEDILDQVNHRRLEKRADHRLNSGSSTSMATVHRLSGAEVFLMIFPRNGQVLSKMVQTPIHD